MQSAHRNPGRQRLGAGVDASTTSPCNLAQRLWVCPSWLEPPDPTAINLLLDPAWHSAPAPIPPRRCAWRNWQDDYGQQPSSIMAVARAFSAVAALKLAPARLLGSGQRPTGPGASNRTMPAQWSIPPVCLSRYQDAYRCRHWRRAPTSSWPISSPAH